MELKKRIEEFLSVIDFKVCTMDHDSITIEDINNKDALNQELKLPIDFTSDDDLRAFKSSKLNNNYSINVLNTKYPKVLFVKNGIESFNLSLRKDNDDDIFFAELFHNDCTYITFIGKIFAESFLGYRKCNGQEIIDINYSLADNSRELEIHVHNHHNNIGIRICDQIIDDRHIARLLIIKDSQEIFRKEIYKKDEIENYFQSLAYKSKDIVEKANEGIKTLNSNIFDMVFSYYDIATQFMSVVNNSTGSNEAVDELFEKFFDNQQNKEEIQKQLKK